jgi:TetR/AcrR family transcriptional repressor of nem operon
MARPLKTPDRPDTATRALDVAERIVQNMGFNWLSYADIASELAIRKASLHHHFPNKGDLGKALIERYSERFARELAKIGARRENARAKLQRYIGLYQAVLKGDRMCLCGMLAAEYASLPPAMQPEIRRFFDINVAWLAVVVDEGRKAKLFHSRGASTAVAELLVSSLEGALLLARPYADVTRFQTNAAQVLDNLNPVAGRRRPRVSRRNRRAA